MKSVRKLALRRDTLTALSSDELDAVVGAQATLRELCETRVTVLQPGCASDPRICHYTPNGC